MKNYALIYFLYKSWIIYILRLKALFLLWLFLSNPQNIYLFFLSLLLIAEVFMRFKVLRMEPEKEVSKNDGKDILVSFTLKALGSTTFNKNSVRIVRKLIKTRPVKFLLTKSDILNETELKFIDVPMDKVLNNAFEIVKLIKGKYVTTVDITASYILLCEDTSRLLFNKNLKKEEFLQILLWARSRYPQEESPKPFRIHFWGEGIAEDWVSGWTIESQKYMIDLTPEILRKKPQAYERQEEFGQLLEAMYKGKSALLVGEVGSGRTEIAEALAIESFMGNLKGNLYHRRFYQLLVDALLAGTDNQGDLESRLDNLISEIAHAGNIIIFLPSFENILGSSSFHLDLSGVLTPYIERGAIRIIGTITPGAYKKFVEGRKTFVSNLEIIKVDEPLEKLALSMLFKKSEGVETTRIQFSYKALIASLKYSKKYLPGNVLPGGAVTLLKDTIATASLSGKSIVEEKDVIEKVEEKTHIAVGKPGKEEKKLLLNLEEEIHKRLIDQEQAVNSIAQALRRLRAGLSEDGRPISFLFLGPTGVGKTETSKALARLYFGGESSMIRLDMSEYSEGGSLKKLLGPMRGEEESGGELTDKILDNPFSLVLLDEFEKASPDILNLFLQVLDDGRLTDNKGRTVSFADSIIIATSNAASEFIREEVNKGTAIDKKFGQQLLEFLQTKGIFKPELLNRFDGIIVFKPLGENEIEEITKILLKELSDKMLEQDITISFDESLIDKIIKEGFDEQFGARPIRRYIQDNVEDQIAQKILKDEIKRGDKIQLTVNNSQITINIE